jgi:CRISPR/Cas system CSM-associated protein Csm5 (group 7 of RAMP superfamily)
MMNMQTEHTSIVSGEIVMANLNTNENLTVHFKVKDFNAWRTSYNGHEKDRVSAGITNGRVFRGADDSNDVLILQDVTDVAKARTWLGSSEMKTTMEKSGVIGSPSIRFAS